MSAEAAPADVVVIGAGIVGAACARELAVRGVGVTLVDRGEIASGTTGLGEGNVLASDKDEGPELTSPARPSRSTTRSRGGSGTSRASGARAR